MGIFNEAFYQSILRAEEQAKRDKLKAFFDGLESGVVKDLDKLYQEDRSRYEVLLNNVKQEGFRVFRNNQGKHKLMLGEC